MIAFLESVINVASEVKRVAIRYTGAYLHLAAPSISIGMRITSAFPIGLLIPHPSDMDSFLSVPASLNMASFVRYINIISPKSTVAASSDT